MTVAYQGVEGAFAHEACIRFLPDEEAVALPTFLDVVNAVLSGKAEHGMLPIANNQAGDTGALELIEKARLHIIDQPVLAVRMHLLGTPSARLDQVRTIVSHPIALRQCARAIRELGVATEETSNTALAAKALTSPSRAVLASEAAAQLYGLAILRRDVHDREDNETRFAIVSRNSR